MDRFRCCNENIVDTKWKLYSLFYENSVGGRRLSVLLFQFGDELQIGARQIGFDPIVDARVQLGVEVILPVARFACGGRGVEITKRIFID